jgi:autotransporter-associated beta strand protein
VAVLSSIAVERRAAPARERLNGRVAALLVTTALVTVAALLPEAARAQNATWLFSPTDGNFDNSVNWTPATVPTGTATFGTSITTGLSFSTNTTIGGWTFNAGASDYTFTNVQTLGFIGAGIVINGGSATITNNNGLSFHNASSAGSAAITSSGLLDFFDSSTAGSAAITNNGGALMRFFNASTAGSANITNNGEIDFSGTTSAVSATITTNSGGVTALANSASGGTARFILNGTGLLDISPLSSGGTTAGSIEGNGNLLLGAKNLTVGGNNLSTTFSGAIQDGGVGGGTGASLTKTGTGTLTLAGANTYTGGTTITAGTLAISADNNLGAASGSLTFNGGTLRFGASFDLANTRAITLNAGGGTFDTSGFTRVFQAISGTGSLTKIGSGTLDLVGVNTYTGTTTVDAGTLAVDGSIALSGITNNSTLIFQGSSTAGSATITNTSTLVFEEGSTAAGATITNNNVLLFANIGTAGSATIITNSGGQSVIESSASGGTARFILNGTGLLDISQLLLSGTTAGSIEGGGGVFLGSKNLAVGGNNLSTIFSGVIQDGGSGGGTGGSLTKTGTGTLTLSGVNTYTGATTVNGGVLEVDGAITNSSSVTVNAGGTLTGTGLVDPPNTVTVASGGTFAPGNGTPGTSMTISGNLAFQSGAQYLVQLNPATSSFANVTGTATLGGATVDAIYASGSYVAKQYTILKATGGVAGTFGSVVNTNLPTNFHTSLSYDANNAYLNLILSFAIPTGLTGNQQNVGNALTNFFNATGSIPMVFGALTPGALTQASGEAATGSQQTTFDAMGMFMGILTDPFIAGRGDGAAGGPGATPFVDEAASANGYAASGKARSKSERDAYAAVYTKAPPAVPFAQRWNVWAAGFGGSQTTDGNAVVGSNTATSRIYGTAVGADYRFSPFTMAGFALAGGGTNFSIANAFGSGRSDLFQAGAYVRHTVGPAYISGALAYGWQDITTDRIVTIAGLDHLRAEFNANAFSGRVEGGYRFATPWLGITPYAAGQFTTFDLPAYAEQAIVGASTFALGYGSKSVTDTRSELGIRTDKSFALSNGVLTLRGRFAWAHDFDPDRSIAATFQALPGASFVVNGAAQASDAALVTASVEKKWLNGWSAAATFEGEFSDVTRSYAGKGVVRYSW